jgi:hypothetical protein
MNQPNRKQLTNDSYFRWRAWMSASTSGLSEVFLQVDQKLRRFLKTQTSPPTKRKVGMFSAGQSSTWEAPMKTMVKGIRTVNPSSTVTPTVTITNINNSGKLHNVMWHMTRLTCSQENKDQLPQELDQVTRSLPCLANLTKERLIRWRRCYCCCLAIQERIIIRFHGHTEILDLDNRTSKTEVCLEM